MQRKYSILHCHTELSSGTTNIDSVTKYEQYIERATHEEDGIYNITFTEHGNIFNWYKKKLALEKAGFKYIHGLEAYITETLDEKVRDNYHCILLAKNYEGFKELNRLVSTSYNRADVTCYGENEHYYYTPRITYDELVNTSENIIILTACLAGILSKGNVELKKRFLKFIIHNKNRCYLEVQHHQCKEQVDYNKWLTRIARKYDLQLVACTDTHSLNEQHAKGREILQKAKGISFENEAEWDLVYKTYDELIDAFKKQGALSESEYMMAIENTNKIVDSIEDFTLDTNTKYPHIYDNPLETFKQKINKAYSKHPYLKKRYSKEQIKEVINNELEVYQKTQSIDFMLLQTYLREWEESQGIQCGYGRGSVSGSEIAYTLGITQMDSIKFGLNFFRFMNPSRVTNADIDTDYSSVDRDKVKYFLLHDHMNLPKIQSAEIITFNTIALKGAIRDVGRALNIPLKDVNDICNRIEKEEDKLRKQYPKLFEYVDIVNGTVVSIGTHPSGVLVSDKNLFEEIGLCSLSTSKYPVSMLNMKELDALMYVKLDILGLDNIGIINESCKLLGIERLTPDNVNLEDEKVWKSIRDNTTLIFQWESDSAQTYLKKFMSDKTLKIAKTHNPDFSYIKWFSFGNGLIRPGCASFRDDIANGDILTTGFKEYDEWLAITFGRITMQEDIMQFLVKFCGYSDAESDTIRRCVDENSLILMGNGNLCPIKNVKVGDYVISFDKEAQTNKYKKVINVFNNGIEDTYIVKTKNGYELIATKNHKVYTQRGWIKISELTTSDFLFTPKKIQSYKDNLKSSNRLSETDMYMIGLLIGDGCIKEEQRIHFTNHEKCLIERYEYCVEKHLNNPIPPEFTYSIQNGVEVNNIYSVYIKSPNYAKSISDFLKRLGLRDASAQKHIPDCIMDYPVGGKLTALLAGLFNTDGGYNKQGCYIEYSSISLQLIKQIKSLLLKYGIYSYISKKIVKNYDYYSYSLLLAQPESLLVFRETILPNIIGEKHDQFEYIINKKINNKLSYNYLLPNECKNEILENSQITSKSIRSVGSRTSNSDLSVHKTEFGISDLKARHIISAIYSPLTYSLLMSDSIPVKIVSIEKYKKRNVYDIEVEDYHNYYANGLLVHNCIGKKLGTEQYIDEMHDRFITYSHEKYKQTIEKLETMFPAIKQGVLDASNYAFSWNHSDAYSIVGYICGYLRYYHPLEFLTASLNVFQDKEDKTLTITEYAKQVDINISLIKFGKSQATYSCDKKTNTIYKGIASIKFLNNRIADELYELKNNKYLSFIELLIDIKEKTSVNSKQLDILIKLDFFSQFGEINQLLKQVEIFDLIYNRKQFRVEEIKELNLPMESFERYANSITEKTIKIFDGVELIKDICSTLSYPKTTIIQKISYQQEFLGYIQTTIPDIKPSYAFVQKIDGQQTRRVSLYRLNDGSIELLKVRKKAFSNNPFNENDIIKTIDCYEEKKWKYDKENDSYYQIDEKEMILSKWSIVEDD